MSNNISKNELTIQVCDDQDIRLDVFLAEKVESLSRSKIHDLILSGEVLVNGVQIKPSHRIKNSETVTLKIPMPQALDVASEKMPLAIDGRSKTHMLIPDMGAVKEMEKLAITEPTGSLTGSTQFSVLFNLILFIILFLVGYLIPRRSCGFILMISGFVLLYMEATMLNYIPALAMAFYIVVAVFIIIIGVKKWLYPDEESGKRGKSKR